LMADAAKASLHRAEAQGLGFVASPSVARRIKNSAKSLLPDAVFLSLLHRKYIGRFPKLLRPTTFNEKILQRSLRSPPRFTDLTDRLAVRKYVEDKIGKHHLIPLIAAPDASTREVFDALPCSFVMKANHGSSFKDFDYVRVDLYAPDKRGLFRQANIYARRGRLAVRAGQGRL